MKAKKNVGYNRKGYSFKKAIRRYKKTGKFRYVKNGSGHAAGENWGDAKNIDPKSTRQKYGKNSPSFDEGVYKSKQKRKLAEGSGKNYYDLGQAKQRALNKKK